MFTRRHFLASLAAASVSTKLSGEDTVKPRPKIKLGFDNFSIRAMGWKAPQLLDHAASLKCDVLFISDLEAYDSLEDAALAELRKKGDDLGIQIYAGGWSVCPTSVRFKMSWGSAEALLRTGIRVAKALGSPVFRCVLGGMDDRRTPGGIRARMADTVKVLKTCRSRALDAGVKIAVENHAGDMHSWELVDLINEAGADFVGATLDSGNATWTLEDPLDALGNLGKYTLCSGTRDSMVWETADGADVQWTAVGDGLVDWKKFAARWAELCPQAPVIVESISGFAKSFPYKKPEFWKYYDKRPEALAHFEAMAKRGHAIPPFKAEGPDKKLAEQEYQKAQLARSLKYLREVIGLGVKA
ncbi:MAG: sugar phosphate isomerase/epimerase [Chthoniobacteraceae bacterium]